MTSVIPEASTATPAPRDQRDSDLATTERIERHVDRIITALAEPTATEAVNALVAEHHIDIEEEDPASLPENLRAKVMAVYVEHSGDRFIVVPAGQDPVIRLHAVRALLARQAVTA